MVISSAGPTDKVGFQIGSLSFVFYLMVVIRVSWFFSSLTITLAALAVHFLISLLSDRLLLVVDAMYVMWTVTFSCQCCQSWSRMSWLMTSVLSSAHIPCRHRGQWLISCWRCSAVCEVRAALSANSSSLIRTVWTLFFFPHRPARLSHFQPILLCYIKKNKKKQIGLVKDMFF